jgi:hypothetical protein
MQNKNKDAKFSVGRGANIVVCGEENSLHGKGRQVVELIIKWRYA